MQGPALEENCDGINWDELASVRIVAPTKGGVSCPLGAVALTVWDSNLQQHFDHRSGMDCKVQWMYHDAPQINSSEWTREEDKLLLHICSQQFDTPGVELPPVASRGGGSSVLAHHVHQLGRLHQS